MPNSKKTESSSSSSGAAEANAKDTRPRRPLKRGGREYPVVRTFYNPRINKVIDVVEVTKTILNPDKSKTPVPFERSSECLDETIQKAHCRPDKIVDVPVDVPVNVTEDNDSE